MLIVSPHKQMAVLLANLAEDFLASVLFGLFFDPASLCCPVSPDDSLHLAGGIDFEQVRLRG